MFWGDQVLFSSHPVKGTHCQYDISVDVASDYLADVMFARLLDDKVTLFFPLPFHTVLFGRTSLHAARAQGVGVTPLSEGVLHGRFVCSPHLFT